MAAKVTRKMPSVFIIAGNGEYANMFLSRGWVLTDRLSEADMVQFTGGADVSPALYSEKPHPTTSTEPNRDAFEAAVFKAASQRGIPMAGICRGGQFLNVMCGGKMWQDVDKHALGGLHVAHCNMINSTVMVSSTHHQMMRPDFVKADILMTARRTTRKERMGITGPIVSYDDALDVEACFYEDFKALCYQPHPEFPGVELNGCREVYFNYIEEHFGLKGGE